MQQCECLVEQMGHEAEEICDTSFKDKQFFFVTPKSRLLACHKNSLHLLPESLGLSHGDNAYSLLFVLLFLLVVTDSKFGIFWKKVFKEN